MTQLGFEASETTIAMLIGIVVVVTATILGIAHEDAAAIGAGTHVTSPGGYPEREGPS